MSTWAVIPVRSFDHGKSRLSSVLEPAARAEYARALFERVVGAAHASAAIDHVLIASDVTMAGSGHDVVVDRPGASLSGIVDVALRRACDGGATRAVVLMSDLPLVTSSDIDELVDRCGDHPIVVVPDHRELGTNALVVALPARHPTCFGNDDSFDRHRALEGSVVHRNARIARDVDTPDDYRDVAALVRTLEQEPAAQ